MLETLRRFLQMPEHCCHYAWWCAQPCPAAPPVSPQQLRGNKHKLVEVKTEVTCCLQVLYRSTSCSDIVDTTIQSLRHSRPSRAVSGHSVPAAQSLGDDSVPGLPELPHRAAGDRVMALPPPWDLPGSLRQPHRELSSAVQTLVRALSAGMEPANEPQHSNAGRVPALGGTSEGAIPTLQLTMPSESAFTAAAQQPAAEAEPGTPTRAAALAEAPQEQGSAESYNSEQGFGSPVRKRHGALARLLGAAWLLLGADIVALNLVPCPPCWGVVAKMRCTRLKHTGSVHAAGEGAYWRVVPDLSTQRQATALCRPGLPPGGARSADAGAGGGAHGGRDGVVRPRLAGDRHPEAALPPARQMDLHEHLRAPSFTAHLTHGLCSQHSKSFARLGVPIGYRVSMG